MEALAEAIGAPLSFAEQLGLDPTENAVTFSMSCKIAARLEQPQPMERPIVVDADPGQTKFAALPLWDHLKEDSKLTHVVETIINWEGEIDKNEIENVVKAGQVYNSMKLPSPLRPKQESIVPFKMDGVHSSCAGGGQV